MIRSMTAFASVERATDWGALGCELRAVNHRYLEMGLRLPDELRALEPALRERIAARVARGKLDLVFRFRPSEAASGLRLNHALLARLSELALDAQARFPRLHVEFTALLAFPGVLEDPDFDQAGLHAQALALLERTLDEFRTAREREGANLAGGMGERLDAIGERAGRIRQWLPEIRAALRQRLQARLADLGGQPCDPGRLEQEIALGLQKLDVDEELDRLDSHLAEARRVLGLDEAVGRRLDFLLQEFNREANTLGSKSVDPRTSQTVVELKVLIEQLREQVQNIE